MYILNTSMIHTRITFLFWNFEILKHLTLENCVYFFPFLHLSIMHFMYKKFVLFSNVENMLEKIIGFVVSFFHILSFFY